MNEDYLWDKSGEPDPQIQELEEILAPLRYQAKPIELPDELVVVKRKRNYFPLLAIAATVLIALFAGVVWLGSRKEKSVQPLEAKSVPSEFKETPTPTPEVVVNTDLPKKPVHRRRKPNFSKHEREEALAAKEQVMVALRLASEKLKLAQRKTQSPQAPSLNQIKNQHRVG